MDEKPKKDLTSILDLPSLDHQGVEQSIEDPFQQVEKVENFESIESLGLMDHVEPMPTLETHAAEVPPAEMPIEESIVEEPLVQEAPSLDEPLPPIESVREYAEAVQVQVHRPEQIPYHFHLLIEGEFDLFARDKLLSFLSDHSIGMSSSELDFQIEAGKVLFPRISEFAAIKLMQELRDAGLRFYFYESDREPDSYRQTDGNARVHFDANLKAPSLDQIPILPVTALNLKDFDVIDSIQVVQHLQSQILEIEKTEVFKQLIERMTLSLKARAKMKGASALSDLKHSVSYIQFPSQYQIELSASILKKRES